MGLADGLVVTSDSISMIVEVARLRRPLAIFPLPVGRLGALDQIRRSLTTRLFAPRRGRLAESARRMLVRRAYQARLISPTRDFRAFHRFLIDQGFAVPLGADFLEPTGEVANDLPRVLGRVKALMAGG